MGGGATWKHLYTLCLGCLKKKKIPTENWINKKSHILNISYSEDTDFSLQGNNTQAVPTRAD